MNKDLTFYVIRISMSIATVDEDITGIIGEYWKKNKKVSKDCYKFDSPKENPDLSIGRDKVANFYGAVINIDHHFWHLDGERNIEVEYGIVDGKKEMDATYLWMKSKQMLDKNPEFFSAKNLS